MENVGKKNVKTYQKQRYEQQLARSRGFCGSSLLFKYSIAELFQWKLEKKNCKSHN